MSTKNQDTEPISNLIKNMIEKIEQESDFKLKQEFDSDRKLESMSKCEEISQQRKEFMKKFKKQIENDVKSACGNKIINFLITFSIFVLISIIVLTIISIYFGKDIKDEVTIKKHRFHNSLRNKLCDNSIFIRKHFNDQDNCCQQIYNSICDKSYNVDLNIDLNIEDKCNEYDSFKPFIQYCLYKIELADYYELIEKIFYP